MFWTPSKSRGSSGCERTTRYTVIVETPRDSLRGFLQNANETSPLDVASLHRLIHLMNSPFPTPPTILILLYYVHSFILFSTIIITYFYKCMNALLQRKEADNSCSFYLVSSIQIGNYLHLSMATILFSFHFFSIRVPFIIDIGLEWNLGFHHGTKYCYCKFCLLNSISPYHAF